MAENASVPADPAVEPARCIGDIGAAAVGPTVVLFGGIHGNEPAGLEAVERVLDGIRPMHTRIRGRVVGLRGNIAASSKRIRFIDRDLNRRWTLQNLEALRHGESNRHRSVEDHEQLALVAELDRLAAEARGPLVCVDLHSSSGPGAPFCCISDTLANRDLALRLGVPVILGLEEIIDGSMLGYLSDLGHVGIAVEGGQNEERSTVDHHCAVVWTVLAELGILDLPSHATMGRSDVRAATAGLPRLVEVRHRHVVTEGDGFVMAPGFSGFEHVCRGQVLAHDDRGPIRAPLNGRVLLPRYQGLGEDGFFLACDLGPGWLRASRWLRAAHADRWVHWLPGVHRRQDGDFSLLVERAAMRTEWLHLLHLLGYRRRLETASEIHFIRRRAHGMPRFPGSGLPVQSAAP